jgi:hypothetical protein
MSKMQPPDAVFLQKVMRLANESFWGGKGRVLLPYHLESIENAVATIQTLYTAAETGDSAAAEQVPTAGPRPCWCVIDYDAKSIIVCVGKAYEREYSGENHIVPTTGFKASKAAWEAFNEWQFGPCPYPIKGGNGE